MVEGIEVKLEADDINAYLSKAIAESLIGEHLKKAIDDVIKEIQGVAHYDRQQNPFYRTIYQQVEIQIEKMIVGQYMPMIQKVVSEQVTEQFTEDLFKKLFQSWQQKY